MDAVGPVVGKTGQRTVVADGRHRDEVRQIVAGRIVRRLFVVLGIVARRRDEQLPVDVARLLDGIVQPLAVAASAPAVVRDLDLQGGVGGRVLDGANGVGRGAGRIQKLQADQLHLPVHAGHAEQIVADGADRARHVRPVADVIPQIGGVVGEIIAAGGDVRGQILMRGENAGVDDADHDVLAPLGDVPRLGRADARHAPQIAEGRIVGRRRDRPHDVVGLDKVDGRISRIQLGRLDHRDPRRQLHVGERRDGELPNNLGADLLMQGADARRRRVSLEADQQFARNIFLGEHRVAPVDPRSGRPGHAGDEPEAQEQPKSAMNVVGFHSWSESSAEGAAPSFPASGTASPAVSARCFSNSCNSSWSRTRLRASSWVSR